MNEFTAAHRTENPEVARARTFTEHYPDGTIASIEAGEVPAAAMVLFERKSELFIDHEDYRPGDFESFFVITHTNGERSYVAQRLPKEYKRVGERELETYVFDTTIDGASIGYGEIRMNATSRDASLRNKPFVGFTETYEAFQRQGYGLRRLRMMNAIAHMRFGKPLRSDANITPPAARRWEQLVRDGRARKYREGKYNRYAFID